MLLLRNLKLLTCIVIVTQTQNSLHERPSVDQLCLTLIRLFMKLRFHLQTESFFPEVSRTVFQFRSRRGIEFKRFRHQYDGSLYRRKRDGRDSLGMQRVCAGVTAWSPAAGQRLAAVPVSWHSPSCTNPWHYRGDHEDYVLLVPLGSHTRATPRTAPRCRSLPDCIALNVAPIMELYAIS